MAGSQDHMSPAASPLSRLLPRARFSEHHHGIIDAPPESVWDAVMAVRWQDLRIGRVLMLARGLGFSGRLERPWIDLFRPVAMVEEGRPEFVYFAMVGKPWSPVPQSATPDSLEELQNFEEPGWLKYGMEWILTPLEGGRTLLETRTLCQPTDAAAHRKFRAYWTLIRPGSGLIRREIIGAVRRSLR
ncbi:MAG: hypothetical protein Q4G64_02410 [bacterium]|nr:hypothetical protein [bacterium]